MQPSLLSGRGQQRLIELHRSVNTALQDLNKHHTVLIGALLGCDATTQRATLDEHRTTAAAALESIARLNAYLEHCLIARRPDALRSD